MNLNKELNLLDRFEKKSLIESLKVVVLAEVTAKLQELYHGQIEPMVNLRKATKQVEAYSTEQLLTMVGV